MIGLTLHDLDLPTRRAPVSACRGSVQCGRARPSRHPVRVCVTALDRTSQPIVYREHELHRPCIPRGAARHHINKYFLNTYLYRLVAHVVE